MASSMVVFASVSNDKPLALEVDGSPDEVAKRLSTASGLERFELAGNDGGVWINPSAVLYVTEKTPNNPQVRFMSI